MRVFVGGCWFAWVASVTPAAAQLTPLPMPEGSEAPPGWQIGFSPALNIDCCGWPERRGALGGSFYMVVDLNAHLITPVPFVDPGRWTHRLVFRTGYLTHPSSRERTTAAMTNAVGASWMLLPGPWARVTLGADALLWPTWEHPGRHFLDAGGRTRVRLSLTTHERLDDDGDRARIAWGIYPVGVGVDLGIGALSESGLWARTEPFVRLVWLRAFSRFEVVHGASGLVFGLEVDRWP